MAQSRAQLVSPIENVDVNSAGQSHSLAFEYIN